MQLRNRCGGRNQNRPMSKRIIKIRRITPRPPLG
jgi:hypothetical protein